MKQIITYFLCALVILGLWGCSPQSPPDLVSAEFYYPLAEMVYDGQTEVIDSEFREVPPFDGNLTSLLNTYFKGPVSKKLVSPFPKGLTVYKILVSEDSVNLIVSQNFSSLTGVDLTMACACIARTVATNSGIARIQIAAKDTKLDGTKFITINTDTIEFVDVPAENPSETFASRN